MVNHQLIRNACKEVQNNLATLPMGCTLTPSIMSNLPNDLIIDIIKIALDAKRVEVDKETHRNKLIDCLITRPTDNFACNFYESHMGYDYWLYTQLDEDEEFMIDESWEDIQKYR